MSHSLGMNKLLTISIVIVNLFSVMPAFAEKISSAQTECKKVVQEINQHVMTSNETKPNCQKAFEIYRDNLKKCYEVNPHESEFESENKIQWTSFSIANCFKEEKKYKEAKEVYQLSLQEPNWTIEFNSEDGHLVWQAALESLEILEKYNPSCVSKHALDDLLEKFHKTQDFDLLKKIRDDSFVFFYIYSESYSHLFSEFEDLLKERIQDSKNWKITPVYREEETRDNSPWAFYVVNGFTKYPNHQLLLAFDNQETKNLKTEKNFSCYVLTGYSYFESPAEMRNAGYVFEQKNLVEREE